MVIFHSYVRLPKGINGGWAINTCKRECEMRGKMNSSVDKVQKLQLLSKNCDSTVKTYQWILIQSWNTWGKLEQDIKSSASSPDAKPWGCRSKHGTEPKIIQVSSRKNIFQTPFVWCSMLNSRSEAVLSFHQLVENSDESFLLDNEACC